jgi:hypothetical protein
LSDKAYRNGHSIIFIEYIEWRANGGNLNVHNCRVAARKGFDRSVRDQRTAV